MNNTSWRLEQLQTRARIQASQGRFWMKQGFGLWLICAVVAFMLGCSSAERKANVVVWLWSSCTWKETVSWQGKNYEPRELAAWISETIYDGTPKEWLVWSLAVGLLPIGAAGGIGVWYVRKKEPGEQHIRGTEMLSREDLQRRLSGKRKPGLEIAGVRIPQELERSHFLICGATGSGKSVTIRHLLRQIEATGEPCVVVDPEGEFTREFYSPERGDYLLNPLDARCPSWSPWAECENESDFDAQAASLFPITPEMNEAATYYHRLARIAYRALLNEIPDHDPRKIPSFIAEAKASKQQQGVMSTLQIACDRFRYLQPGTRQWSAREWVKNPQGWCFFTFQETQKDAVLPIISLQMEGFTRRLLNSELNPVHTFRIVIDEMAVLQAQPTLPHLMTRGRKRGVSVTLGFQNVMQLYAIYGKEMTTDMLDQPATRLLLKTNNGETQRWCSGDIGRREVERALNSEAVGPENVRDTIGRSYPRREEPAVMGSQFGSLPNLSGYLKVAHYGAAKVQVPYLGMVERQPAFVGRADDKNVSGEEPPEPRVVSRKRRML